MSIDKTDRRVRRTKSLLTKGLMQLMEEKDIRDITVRELSDLADINRGTFYLHYKDIYELLEKIEDELFTEFNDILNRHLTGDFQSLTPRAIFEDIFSFLEKHREEAKVMVGSHGDPAFVNRLKNLVKEHMDSIADLQGGAYEYEYAEAFIVSGCTGVIETWLKHPNPQPPSEMAAYCSDFLIKGLTAAK